MTEPVPEVMPLDRAAWSQQLDLSNFVNSYYQYRDLIALGGIRRVLIVGPGQGLDTQVLRWRGYDVVTFDIDDTFKPDVLGSVHDMHMFSDRQFDAVIASHVLEHLPLSYLDAALREIARTADAALVYLPATGRSAQLRIKPGLRNWDWSFVADFYNYLKRPDPKVPRFCGGQHFFEVGRLGFSDRAVRRRFSSYFDVVDAYRNVDWLPSMNYVLRTRRGS